MHLLPNKEFDIGSISLMTLKNLDLNDLYVDTDFEVHDSNAEKPKKETHKTSFVSNVIETYINIKAHKIGNKIRDEERGLYIWHSNTKQIHTSGQ